MERLPKDIIKLIVSKLDTASFVNFYETGWSGAHNYPNFDKIFEKRKKEFLKDKREKICPPYRNVIRCVAKGVSGIPSFENFDNFTENNMDHYDELFMELNQKYKDQSLFNNLSKLVKSYLGPKEV